ncbi:DUF2726 domain-containing protein [Endozoicomonas sp. GU-1]|uniref:DUF2726 domain-containing protein n=1 Tax=Endozoicomonas sp. GU-1 TaxID=3009078 RepID=UPI0022B536CF|nr:DUF2726 domain-containing protein [Endozoicomonas sp. GU-1]WBA80457.1 DUF2726 domain-containing protein [Endozoicomonas sp. GU-1]WBA88019.1 DUF2726 domain-containing protein [Endozoicomonas sp. GU-1]
MLLDSFSLVVSGSLIVLIAAIAWFLWLTFSPFKAKPNTLLFDQDKRAFFGQLDIAVRSHLMVLPSLPVGDVLAAGRFSRTAMALNIKKNRRFDFVLYHRKKMEICCVINLIPYNTKSNSKEFKLLRQLCEAAELPLLEYDMKPWRDVTELRRTVLATCGFTEEGTPDYELPTPREAIAEVETIVDPQCPKCHSPMRLRTLKKSPQAGLECWVCSTYPSCKGARMVHS